MLAHLVKNTDMLGAALALESTEYLTQSREEFE
jgi:hypothetical protein